MRWFIIIALVSVMAFFHFFPTTVLVSFDNKLAGGYVKISPRYAQ